LFGQSRIGGNIFREIVGKLRSAPNVDATHYAYLARSKIAKLIKSDIRLRSVVNSQDQDLLRLLIVLQVFTGLVLIVCGFSSHLAFGWRRAPSRRRW
jgi:hypothetical protein